MQQHGIRARGQRRFRVVTTDSGHDLPIAPHLLNRNFTVQAPNRTWSGDITYIPTEEGWLFLAVVIDLFSRRVVGWSMREDLHRSLVIDALEMGWFQRRPRKGELIFHSDRGSQYASEDFRQVLDRHGIRAWMSRRGNCWDNAVTETLFGSLKVERLHGERFLTLRQAKDAVLAWLLWYNQQRMHSTLNYVSPAQYEQQWSQARPGRGTDPGNRLRRFPHFHRHHHDGNMIPLTRSLRDTHSEGKIRLTQPRIPKNEPDPRQKPRPGSPHSKQQTLPTIKRQHDSTRLSADGTLPAPILGIHAPHNRCAPALKSVTSAETLPSPSSRRPFPQQPLTRRHPFPFRLL